MRATIRIGTLRVGVEFESHLCGMWPKCLWILVVQCNKEEVSTSVARVCVPHTGM